MTAGEPLGTADLFASYVRALRDGDRRRAFRLIDDAHGAGIGLATIYMEVLQPAMREIGRLWQENEINVADEHLATAITQSTMARVYGQTATWDSDRPRRSLLGACVDTERHEVGLRMLCDLLECEGWDTTYLGATVPIDSLVMMLRRTRPDVLALSAALPPHLPRLRDTIRAVRLAFGGPGESAPLVLVGGRPFVDDPSLAAKLGADLTAPDAATAVRVLRERVGAKAA